MPPAKEMRAGADGHREEQTHEEVHEQPVVLLFEKRWVYLPAIET
jgi:hypothetical protein